MYRATRHSLPAAVCLCVSALLIVQATADESVTAYLLDGRAVTGAVDAKTDARYLWLRRSSEQFDLISGYPWELVFQGHVQDRRLSTLELKEWTVAHRQPGRRIADIGQAIGNEVQMVSATAPALPARPVKTLVVDAELAQWDKDAQTDGLRVFVYPLDAYGQIVPVDGHVELTLVVERDYTRGAHIYHKGPEFLSGDRQTFPVRWEHFSAGIPFYELAFDRWHPDFEHTLAEHGLLHARLSVPGQGVFEASDPQVCLRESSRFRDQLQLYTPGRYLPLERPSRDGR